MRNRVKVTDELADRVMQSAKGFRIPIKQWSATDYAYLVNEQLGWVDAAQENYCFATEEEMGRFKAYLKPPEQRKPMDQVQ